MQAVADACHQEDKAITDAGLIVQVDEPEFCSTWSFYPDWSVDDLRKYLSSAVEIINHGTRLVPGVIGHATDLVENYLIKDRLLNYARASAELWGD